MSNLASCIFFVLVFVLAGWIFMVWRGFTHNWLPPELALSKVTQVERNLFINTPFAIVGRPDQVYQLPGGLHVPLEYKNRNVRRASMRRILRNSLCRRGYFA